MKKNTLLTIIITFFLLSACSRNAAQVGSIAITDQDIDLRAKVSEIYYPGSGKRYVGLTQLIKGCLSLEILKSLGHNVDDSVIETEARRIDVNTKAPEMLAKIKAVYGNDRYGYLNTFVKPAYAERVLYAEVFLKSKEIHATQRQKAQLLLQEATSDPGVFSRLSQKQSVPSSKLLLSPKKGIVPFAEKNKSDVGKGFLPADGLLGLLKNVKPGAVVPEIIEMPEAFLVVRFLKKSGEDSIVESVSVPKRGFDNWFWEMAAKIPVRINDPALKAEFLKEVSWANNLKL